MALNYVPTTTTPADLSQARMPSPPDDDPPGAPAPSSETLDQSDDLLEHLLAQADPLAQAADLSLEHNLLIGRDELLADIRARLLAGPVRVALEGPPGIGKTRLALELAGDEEVQRRFESAILWMSLGQQPEIEAHLRAWAATLGLKHDPRLNTAEQLARLTAQIDERGVPCLLILDDVWKAEHCAGLLRSTCASVLITGRQHEASDLGELVEEQHLIAVAPLDEPHSIELLSRRSGLHGLESDDQLALLAALVGGSPLALVLTGNYVREHYQDEGDWLARTLEDLHQAAQRAKLPTEQIEQARRNLQDGVLARLRHKPIPASISLKVVVELCVSALPPGARGAFGRLVALPADPLSFGLAAAQAAADVDEEALQALVDQGLLEDAGAGRFRLHRLLTDWINQRYHAEAEEARKRLGAWHLGLARGGSDELEVWQQHPDNWPPLLQLWHKAADNTEQVRAMLQGVLPLLLDSGCWSAAQTGLERILEAHQRDRALAPLTRYHLGLLYYRRADFIRAQEQAAAALEGFEQAQQSRSQAMTLNLIGHIQKAAGDYTAARTSYETALGLTPEGDARQRAACLTNIALLLQAEGDYAAARPLYNQALTLCEQTLDPRHPDIAASLANLAGLLHDLGHYAAARPLCERALAIHEQALGASHPHTATSLTSLARLFQAQGDYAAARPLYERALTIHEQALGPQHPDTATSLDNLASLLHDLGDYAGARQLYERALTIHEQALGPEHADTATSLDNLASLLHDLGHYAAARPLYERALAIHERTPGPNHPDTAASLINLASLLKAQGALSTARPLYERALAIHEQALGASHPHTAASLTSLARLFQAQGDFAAARPLYERALAIRAQRLGPQHPATADSLGNLAGLLREQGDLPAARTHYERALAIHELALGADHPGTAASLTNLANALQAQGDFAAARPLYERALTIRTQSLGPQHPDTAASLSNVALLRQSEGNYDEARRLYKNVLDIRMNMLGAQHPQTAASLSNLASLLQAQRDFANARTLYEHALAIHEQALGPQHPDTATSLNNLALMHKAQGNLAAARPLYERALAIRTQSLGPQHPDTATSLNNLASLLYELGDLESARPLCLRALAIRGHVLGSEHPHTITSLINLALLERDAGKFEEAAQLLQRAYAQRSATLGAEHASTLRLKQLLEEAKRRLAQPDEPA